VKSRPILIAIGSLIALGILAAILYWRTKDNSPAQRPIIVYAAPAVRVPLEAIAKDFEAETGHRVELRFGASEDVLTKAGMVNPAEPADLLFPADASYVQLARERGLISEQFPIATMKIVVFTAKGNPKNIAAWPDLLRDGVKVAVPNTSAAVGKIARDHLVATDKWAALQPHVIGTINVTEAANAAKIGSVDAAIVWDAVAAGYKEQTVLALPEFDGVTARVELAILNQSSDPAAARRFAEYVAAADHGLKQFRAAGFKVIEPSDAGEKK
jgi:molybdenum ABC transporter molybdate-binding protein